MPVVDWRIYLKKTHGIFVPLKLPDFDPITKKWSDQCYSHYKQPESNKQKGLSDKSQVRIKNAVNLLIDCSTRKTIYSIKEKKSFSYKVGFMTLTLPSKQIHTDRETHYKIFAPFVRVLKEKYGLAEYIWKAETQENGNLHYHITINQFIHHADINKEWVKQLSKNGYTWKKEKDKTQCSHVKATRSIKNLAGYLCKYLSKKDLWKEKTPNGVKAKYDKWQLENKGVTVTDPEILIWMKRQVEMKLWDCSENLKNKKCCIPTIIGMEKELLQEFENIIEKEINEDFYGVWIWQRHNFERQKILSAIYNEFIESVRIKGKQKECYTIASFSES